MVWRVFLVICNIVIPAFGIARVRLSYRKHYHYQPESSSTVAASQTTGHKVQEVCPPIYVQEIDYE